MYSVGKEVAKVDGNVGICLFLGWGTTKERRFGKDLGGEQSQNRRSPQEIGNYFSLNSMYVLHTYTGCQVRIPIFSYFFQGFLSFPLFWRNSYIFLFLHDQYQLHFALINSFTNTVQWNPFIKISKGPHILVRVTEVSNLTSVLLIEETFWKS